VGETAPDIEAVARPYRWGNFQGGAAIALGCVFLFLGGAKASFGEPISATVLWVGGAFLVVCGWGLRRRRRYGPVLVFVFGAFTLLDPLIFRPKHPEGYVFQIIGLLFWCVPAALYYPKRWREFGRRGPQPKDR
jgi:hypothetical protein